MADATSRETSQIIERAETLEATPRGGGAEKRRHQRVPYEALVCMILTSPDGRRTRPMLLRAGDLSSGGLLVYSSRALPVGAIGMIQLVKPGGQFGIVGIQIKHSRYAGNLEHRNGLSFIPLPAAFSREEFLDEKGHMLLLDPLLRQNLK